MPPKDPEFKPAPTEKFRAAAAILAGFAHREGKNGGAEDNARTAIRWVESLVEQIRKGEGS